MKRKGEGKKGGREGGKKKEGRQERDSFKKICIKNKKKARQGNGKQRTSSAWEAWDQLGRFITQLS